MDYKLNLLDIMLELNKPIIFAIIRKISYYVVYMYQPLKGAAKGIYCYGLVRI